MTALPLALLLTVAPVQDERPAGPDEWGFRPAVDARVDRNPPAFSWRPQKGASTYVLQVALDPSFEEVDYEVAGLEWNVHCPPRTLAPWAWYWRFRVSGDEAEWSTARTFHMEQDAATFVLPERAELLARIPDGHPRLFLRPEDLPRLRAEVADSLAGRFAELEVLCDRLLADPPSTNEPPAYTEDTPYKSEAWRERWWGNRKKTIAVLEGAATLAFTWRLGGREEYGDLARRLLLEAAAWDPKGSTGYRTNDEAGMPYAYHFSRTYTFLHPLLEESERAACRKVMLVRGKEMYAHLSPGHFWKPYSSHSNRAWHFLGEVGLAFHGELEEADDWVWFAANVFACVYPVWSDSDGGWHEGLAYWRSYLSRFTWWADIQRSALGIDAYSLPFFASVGDFALYHSPPGSTAGGFGDLAAGKDAPGNRGLMTLFATQAGNSIWAEYVERLGGPDPGKGYVGFLRSALPGVTPGGMEGLPTSRLFRGTGVAVLNTTLDDARDNLQVVFKSSPFGTRSHGYESQNAFLLRAFGERLFLRSGHRDVYGSDHHKHWMWETRSVNSILVGGRGQRVHSSEAIGEVTGFHTEDGLHWVEGEAAKAYADGVLERFRREVLLVEPDLVVIRDRLRATEATTFDWLLHAPVPFDLAGAEATIDTGAVSCRVQFLAPTGLHLSQTDRFEPPPRERVQLVQHHLTARSSEQREVTFLTVMRPWRTGRDACAPVTLVGRELQAPMGDGGVIHVDLTQERLYLGVAEAR